MSRLKAASILRAKKGCSMVSIARDLKVSRDVIYRTLTRENVSETNPTLLGICDHLGVTLAEFDKLAKEC